MTFRKAMSLFIILNALYFAAIAGLIYWGATKLYDFSIYQGWIRP